MLNFRKFGPTFLFGFGAGFITRDLLSSGSSIVRPIFKGFVRAGLNIFETGRESVATFTETMEDLVAEVRSEEMLEKVAKREKVGVKSKKLEHAETKGTTAAHETGKAAASPQSAQTT